MSTENKRALRTVLQTAVALAIALPVIVDASGIPQTAGGVSVGLAVAGGVARVMALPQVQAILPRWLRTDDAESGG